MKMSGDLCINDRAVGDQAVASVADVAVRVLVCWAMSSRNGFRQNSG